MEEEIKRIAILASGGGSNADNILNYFADGTKAEVALLACNKEGAGAFEVANKWHIPSFLLTKENFLETEDFIEFLQEMEVDFVVLAGFLWKVPSRLISMFPNRIVNIHPALLPKYGGKGMYGHFVHEAVHAAGEKESGITVHYVNENYDEGAIIFQATATIDPSDGPAEIEKKVRKLEIEHFPKVIESIL
ncbi:MAG: phosphoribosylglycinamide formyltransferase [Flavobacteriales bacterium]